MSYSHAANQYRDRQVRTASPGQLVVMVYDHVLVNLARARMGHQANNVALRIESLSKARDGLVELLATLDMEKGGAIAAQLRALYSFMLTQLADAGARFDEHKVERIAGLIKELRDAFATIVADQRTTVTAA
jgi:flagellar protein FliS